MRTNALLLNTAALASPGIVHMSAYANTLTRLIPELYAALDVVSRELVGMIPSVSRNTGAERAAVGQAVVWPVAPQMGTFDVTPAMAIPNPADVTIGNGDITITKSKGVEFGWTGEEQLGLSHGAGAMTVQGDLFAQGLRTLVNEIEADLALEAALNASRAYGTAATAPFSGTDLEDGAQVRKILDDNGAPASERSLIINTSAGVKMRKHGQLSKVNEAGDAMNLRQGELQDLFGMSVKESAGVRSFTPGTAAGATTNATGYAVGATTITLAAAGNGTLKKGDVITFAGDANKYVVAANVAAVSGATLTLQAPGLRQAIPALATNITVTAAFAQNVAFTRSAMALAARAPALPQEGDAAVDRFTLVDPRSGIPFEVSLYAGYRKIRAEVALAWGVKATKSAHIALLLG